MKHSARAWSVLGVIFVASVGGCTSPRAGAPAALVAADLYNGVGRSVGIGVPAVPEPSMVLLDPVTNRRVAEAKCGPGSQDLSVLFPALWSDPPDRVLYAQLCSRGRAVGAPLVLQPMLSPKTAALVEAQSHRAYWIDDSTGKPEFEGRSGVIRYYAESPVENAGLRIYRDQRVVLETTLGEMEFALRPDAAPNTVFNFLHLVEGGFYRQIVFHRVVPVGRDGKPFVIQVGDPTATGDGGPGYSIDMEASTLAHDFGVISMARDSEPNTAGSQVFVCLSREGTARLDGKYCAFGELTRGAGVVRAIAMTEVMEGTDRPRDPPVLLGARLVDAPPRQPAP